MTIDTITVGRQARVKIGSNTVCFARFVPRVTRELVKNADGAICGNLWHPVNRVRKGRKIVNFSLFIDLTGAILTHVLPYMGMTDLTGGVYNLAATGNAAEVDIYVDLGAAVHRYTNCVCAGFALRGSKGSRPLQLQLNYSAEDEIDPGSAFTDAPLTIEDIFSLTDCTVSAFDDTSGGTNVTLSMDRFLIQVDWGLVTEHNSSVTRTGAKYGDATAVVATSTPYVAGRKDIYWDYRDSEGPVDGTITFANADTTMEWAFPAGVPITETPGVMSKADQIRTPVTLDLQRTDNAGTYVSPLTLTVS